MSIRFIPSLPRGGIVDDEDTSRSISRRIHDAYMIQNNLGFMSDTVTGNDGVTYTWVNTNAKRTGFADDTGYARGNPSSDIDDMCFTMYDSVGQAGSYILKLGFGADQNHRWLRGVVGFDTRINLHRSSTSSTNDPFIGKIGMIYRNVINNTEIIYRPTVSMRGTTGNIEHGNSFQRIARKLVYKGGPYLDFFDMDLLFTGIIFEFGHTSGGGAVETQITLRIKDFKPIFSVGKDTNTSVMAFGNIPSYELIPRMRPWNERDNIQFDTNVDIT